MDDRRAEDERIIGPYREQAALLKQDVDRLDKLLSKTTEKHEAEMDTLRDEHLECVRKHAALEAKVEVLQTEVLSLRQWRHDRADVEHTDSLRRAENREAQ